VTQQSRYRTHDYYDSDAVPLYNCSARAGAVTAFRRRRCSDNRMRYTELHYYDPQNTKMEQIPHSYSRIHFVAQEKMFVFFAEISITGIITNKLGTGTPKSHSRVRRYQTNTNTSSQKAGLGTLVKTRSELNRRAIFFTVINRMKSAKYLVWKFSPHLNSVAAIPCENKTSKNLRILHEDNKTVVILKLIDIVNTLLVHTLLDYATQHVTYFS